MTKEIFNKANEARRAARQKAAKPGATKRIPNKKAEEDFFEDGCPYCAVRGCDGLMCCDSLPIFSEEE